jgi:hypothetical protein
MAALDAAIHAFLTSQRIAPSPSQHVVIDKTKAEPLQRRLLVIARPRSGRGNPESFIFFQELWIASSLRSSQ